MEIALEKYCKKIKISSCECNLHTEMLIASIFKHFTEIAWEHVKAAGFAFEENIEAQYKWILLRLNLNIKSLPKWQDIIIVETWPSGIKSNYFSREFRMIDKYSGKELVAASSDWVVIDKKNNSKCVPEELEFYRKPKHDKAVSKIVSDKIKPSKNLITIEKEIAKYSDIDLHHHVNNSVYVRWIENAIGDIFPRRINIFKVHYISEVFENDNIVISADKSDNNMYFECYINDDKLCFRAEVELY